MWLEIGKIILEIFNRKKAEKKEDRQRLATIFLVISEVLIDSAEQMEKDIYPSGNCQTLRHLSLSLMPIISPLMDEKEVAPFAAKLVEASNIEMEFGNRKDKGVIPNIYEAAGMFKAASILYK